MKERPWYKRFPSNFLNGVVGLGPDVIGCYAVALDLIYDRDGPIPNDARHMGGILGCSPRMARKLIDRLVGCGKLFETPSGLTNMRAEVEITKRKKEARKSVENGSKGGRKRVENATRTKEINDLIQASLKHRAGVIFQKEEDSYLLGTSPAPATLQEGLPASQEARKEDPPKSPAAPPILVSDALASMFRLPRAPDDGFAHDLEIPAILRRSA